MTHEKTETRKLQPERYRHSMTQRTITYAVWYASAGCLSDSGYPEFVGTLAECEAFIEENEDDYKRPGVEHDLYSLSIGQVGYPEEEGD